MSENLQNYNKDNNNENKIEQNNENMNQSSSENSKQDVNQGQGQEQNQQFNQSYNQQQNFNQNIPPQGTKEYDEMMRAYYGQNYDASLRVSFMKRVGATILDSLFTGMILIIIMFTFGDFSSLFSEYMSVASSGDVAAITAFIQDKTENSSIVQLIMFVSFGLTLMLMAFEVFMASSPGKLIFGIKIAQLNRQNADFKTLLNRSLLKHSSNILQFLGFALSISLIDSLATFVGFIVLIAYLFALSEQRQTLYDKIVGTTVYHTDDIIQ